MRPPESISFKYPWRSYQQRVLDELDHHLSDKHLHVIAPPGSGKTVLGLEVALRLNKPVLILTPTITIRNQWIHRFCECFLQTDLKPDWISNDVRNPKWMTVVTYQGLHAACNDLLIEEEDGSEEEEAPETRKLKVTHPNLEAIVNGLKSQDVQTIVVDEAHHLKNEWWHTLNKVKKALDPIVVGLTATPPYDATGAEWQRYTDLNGPVDAEISVPELIQEGDLCPHQDYVFFCLPTEQESNVISEFKGNVSALFQEIRQDVVLARAIENHPIWKDPLQEINWIYENLAYYSACLIFLHDRGIRISENHLAVIGDRKPEIPELDTKWMETLLEFYLYADPEHFPEFEDHRAKLEAKLRRTGIIERKQIHFSQNDRLTKTLTSSISKLDGIREIVDFEYAQMGSELRMVILSDYIRKEFLVDTESNTLELNKIGVLSVFEKLRREKSDQRRIGVLTGSVVIIPREAYTAMEEEARKMGVNTITMSELPFDKNYVLIRQSDQLKHVIVHLVTTVFQEGGIEILIGTKSLLGEGWDAPAINSLILATVVGSFVLSNQMRGRAIRIERGNAHKVGNIWHLACIDTDSQSGGPDMEMLRRRFRSFVGISFNEGEGIENGVDRLDVADSIGKKESLLDKNKRTFYHAKDRNGLKQRWNLALEKGTTLVEEIKIPFQEERTYSSAKHLYISKTIKNLVISSISALGIYLVFAFEIVGKSAEHIWYAKPFDYILLLVLIGFVLFFGRRTFLALKVYFQYRDISKDLKEIGEALLSSLYEMKVISSDLSRLKVVASANQSGTIYCHLEGGTSYEKSVFIQSLQEICEPIKNPRYVIIRKNQFLKWVKQKDYHAVPEILGKNKISAAFFEEQWERRVGNCEMIFTRTIEGRKLLLKSRVKSLAAQLDDKHAERISIWK